MSSTSKPFAPKNNNNDDSASFIEHLRSSKLGGSNSTSTASTFNFSKPNFAGNNSSAKKQIEEPVKEISDEDYLKKLMENKSDSLFEVNSSSAAFASILSRKDEPEVKDNADEFLEQMRQKHSGSSSLSSSSAKSFANILSRQDEEPAVNSNDFIEQMRLRRLETSKENTITTVTLDARYGRNSLVVEEKTLMVPKAVEEEKTIESDEDSDEINYDYEEDHQVEESIISAEDIICSIVYRYDTDEVLKTTPPLSKENMINFLSKQGNNGGFDPIEAYNNTLSSIDKNALKVDIIKRNILKDAKLDVHDDNENQKIIDELSARKSSLTNTERKQLLQAEQAEKARKKLDKEVNKALRAPSKKVQEMIDKNNSAKVDKKLTGDEINLGKLQDELERKRIKTVHDAANWVMVMNTPESKIRALEIIFLALNKDIYNNNNINLTKIIFIEIIRRIEISLIDDVIVKKALETFSRTFNPDQIIQFQLKEMEDIIPPFSPFEKKIMELDSWQIDVFNHIKNKVSVIIDAPTSSGKTVCATFCVKVYEKVLFVLPSKELANQVAGTIRNMKTATTSYIPIKLITDETIYQDENPRVYIGTPIDLERYFNLEGAKRVDFSNPTDLKGRSKQFDIGYFEYLIVDEIHQLNSETQGPAMQRLIKRFQCPILCLSATIGNPEQIPKWVEYLKSTTPNIRVERVSYDKRFINQQKHVWDGNELLPIHPLAVISRDFLQANKLLTAEMQFIPNDLFRLYTEMVKCYPAHSIQSIVPVTFFQNACISLNQCKEYEVEMKRLLTALSHEYPNETTLLLSKFIIKDIQLKSLEIKDVYTVLKSMQVNKKLPAIVFKFDQTTCRQIAHDLLEYMETEEQLKYPHYKQLREFQNEYYKRMESELERIDDIEYGRVDDIKNAKLDREMHVKEKFLNEFIDAFRKKVEHIINKYRDDLESNSKDNEYQAESKLIDTTALKEYKRRLRFYVTHYTEEHANIEKMTELRPVNEFAPHPDFTFSNLTISMTTMIEIKNLLKEYTTQIVGNKHISKTKLSNDFNIGYNHFFLKAIERGFVLYLSALPVPFQRIGQMLIADGAAPVTFSDRSLAYGVNYSIRSVVLLGSANNDIIDRADAHQASGRSGRRGLDTKGHTVYVGVNWLDLTSSEYINIVGANPDTEYMTLPHEFNRSFNVKSLYKTSLADFCRCSSIEEAKEIEQERSVEIKERHDELVKRLGVNNYMHVYRLSEYGQLSEVLIKFLKFLSSKLYTGINIEKTDLFEMIGTLVDNYKEESLEFDNEQNRDLMFEFQSQMAEQDQMIELYGFNKLTKCFKKQVFNTDISCSMSRLKHFNEIIKILYNQTHTLKRTKKWVEMLLQIFVEIKSQIIKNII